MIRKRNMCLPRRNARIIHYINYTVNTWTGTSIRFVLYGNECMADSTGNLIAPHEETIKWENIPRETRAALLSPQDLRLTIERGFAKGWSQ